MRKKFANENRKRYNIVKKNKNVQKEGTYMIKYSIRGENLEVTRSNS